MRVIITFFLTLLLATQVQAAVLFETNFDSDADWTVVQPTDTSNNCWTGCESMPTGITAYYNGRSYCSGIDEPGNNNLYLDTGAGNPSESNACNSGAKCVTYWAESCTDQLENSDGNLGIDLGQEYSDLYVRFKIRFKANYQLIANFQFKMYHVQHVTTEHEPFAYFTHPENRPTSSGGFSSYGDNNLYFYANARCLTDNDCYGDINWSLGSIADNRSSGLLDGNWHTIELRHVANSEIGATDGMIELWVDGTKKSYAVGYEGDVIPWSDTGSAELRGFRFVALGGNSNNQWDVSCANMAECEQWYSIDDVVVATTYVGTDYSPGASSSGATFGGGTFSGKF